MLPTRLNVLPPDKQKHLQAMIRNEFIRSTLGITIVVASIIGMSLVGGRLVLESYFADLADTINAVTVNTKDKNAKIEQANSRIAVAGRVLGSYEYWPDRMAAITSAIPDGVLISRMLLNPEAGEASVTGVAVTRTTLLELGDALRAIAWIEKVDIPISQLTKQSDISFTLRIDITE